MRPVLALLLSIFLFGGVYAYTEFAESVRRPPLQVTPKLAAGSYSVQIDRSFDCVGDEDWGDVASLVVKFRGHEILRRTDTVPAGELILIDPLENVEQLENEIYVFANVSSIKTDDDWDAEPADNDESKPSGQRIATPGELRSVHQALRITARMGDRPLAVKTVWLEPGAMTIQATLSFVAPAEATSTESDNH
jgi:hypothetical protein